MDPFLLIFLLLTLIGIITVSVYYFKEKSHEYHTIKRGFCPKCRQKSILLTDKRGGGCSGTTLLTYRCELCDYHNSFSITENGCNGGKCG